MARTTKNDVLDPFSEDENTETAEVTETVWDDTTSEKNTDDNPRPMVVEANGEVVVTLKAGTGYDAPWIVIHGTSMEDVFKQLKHELLPGIMETTGKAASYFAKQFSPAPKATPTPPAAPKGNQGGNGQSSWGNSGGGNSGGGRPQSNWSRGGNSGGGGKKKGVNPGDPAPECSHGEMIWSSGTSKAGNYYEIFKCPRNDRGCDGVFVNLPRN